MSVFVVAREVLACRRRRRIADKGRRRALGAFDSVAAGFVAVEALWFVLVAVGASVVALVVVFVFGAVGAVPLKYVRMS